MSAPSSSRILARIISAIKNKTSSGIGVLSFSILDKVDSSTSLERQRYMLTSVLNIYNTKFSFDTFEEVATYFKRIINQMRQINYSEFNSEKYIQNEKELFTIIDERKIA